MPAQKLKIREQIVKTVVKSGNGGAVWVPKDWLGEEVVVTLPERPRLSFKERIIRILEPHLEDVVAVAVYGSYARKEQQGDSDIDILVVTGTKKTGLKFKEENLDIVSLSIDELKIAVEKHPALYYQIVQEAVPLINASVFKELKKIKAGKENFKAYLSESREHLKSSRELLELDKLDSAFLQSYSVLYSAILRLRGLFVMRCALNNSRFSGRAFRSHLLMAGLTIQEFKDSYNAYRLVRDGKSTINLRIKAAVAKKLLDILEKELTTLEA